MNLSRILYYILIIFLFIVTFLYINFYEISEIVNLMKATERIEGIIINKRKVSIRRGLDHYFVEYEFVFNNKKYSTEKQIYPNIFNHIINNTKISGYKISHKISLRLLNSKDGIITYPSDFVYGRFRNISVRIIYWLIVFILIAQSLYQRILRRFLE